jgi:hypothetical protein
VHVLPASVPSLHRAGFLTGNSSFPTAFSFASHTWSHKGNVTRSSPTESEDSGDLKKDAIFDLCVVVGLFVHSSVWWCACVEWACVCMIRYYNCTQMRGT